MKKYRKTFIAGIAIFIMFASACMPVQKKQTYTFYGLTLETELYGTNAAVAEKQIAEAARALCAEIAADEQKFNACEGTVAEAGENVLGETEYTVATEVGRHTYECFVKAKNWYVRSNGAYNVADKRLRSLYGSGKPFPTESAISREINGLQVPLLVDEYTKSGRFYLAKYVTFTQNGELDDEHTYLGFDNIMGGFVSDCIAPLMTANAVYGKITAGDTTVYCGNDPRSKDGRWTHSVSIQDLSLGFTISVAGGEFVSVKSISDMYELGGLSVGSIINPVNGLPTTLEKNTDGFIEQAKDYAVCAAIIGSSGFDSSALSFSACVLNADCAGMISAAKAKAVIVMRSGTVYTVGDIRCSVPDGCRVEKL